MHVKCHVQWNSPEPIDEPRDEPRDEPGEIDEPSKNYAA